MKSYQLTGGARIGKANATYPFAKLKVTPEKLEVNASIIGNLVFQPADIISIERYTQIPVLGQGVKINHNVEAYEKEVIFWTFKKPETVIAAIQQTGFLDEGEKLTLTSRKEILIEQKKGGFPLKKSVAILAVILWNILFLHDFMLVFNGQAGKIPFGNGIKSALGLVFISSLLILFVQPFRKLILKEGRGLKDIKTFAYFLLFISGFMLFTIVLSSILE